jgi:uncharacterized protein
MNNSSFDKSVSITKYEFSKTAISKIEDHLWKNSLWPLVYIISDANKKEAYIGESTNAISRINNHLTNADRNKLNSIHLITSDKFNKSATLDIESNLIKYIAGDGIYKLQNGNIGLAFHEYYQKKEYFELFVDIWTKLKKENLVFHELKWIDNSDLFKYSPYKSLTDDQYKSVERIINVLVRGNTKSIFIEGGAGTGKTILAVFLIKLLVTDFQDLYSEDNIDIKENKKFISELKQKYPKPKVALVVPMTSLRNTLKKVFKNIKGLSPSMVIGPSEVLKENYDILLVDEAHRLRRRKNITNYKSFDDNNKKLKLGINGNELDWILLKSKKQIFFYDSGQSIKPSDIRKENFETILKKSETVRLISQLRVKGGLDYIKYVDDLLRTQLTNKNKIFKNENYEFYIFDSLKDLIKRLKEKESETGLSRLVAGYAWEWKSKGQKNNVFDINIEGLKLKWNSDFSEWINSENAPNEVGCIHTTQGYDLNYTGVIFGPEISYDPVNKEIIIIPENYRDKNGRNGINDPKQLKEYILNIYRTLMYRGIKGTFVYACDHNLKQYLKEYIPVFGQQANLRILSDEEIVPYVNCVPLYNLSVAAGSFSEPQIASDCKWVQLPEKYKPSKEYFVCKVVGESMNKIIPNGSWCLFQKDFGGSRQEKIVLVQHHQIQDSDFGSGYTVKKYNSKKVITEGSWSHQKIVLEPQSTDRSYKVIELSDENLEELKVLGFLVSVL